MSAESRLFNFRAKITDLELWHAHAAKKQMALGALIRQLLNRDMSQSETTAVTADAAAPVAVYPPDTALSRLVEKAKANTKCERRLPKGAFCKTCGRIHP
jgi:hypothetical protein